MTKNGNIKQITGDKRAAMSAPRGRGSGKAKSKIKTGGLKAQYTITYANQTHRHKQQDFGFGGHFATYHKPRLKEICLSIAPDAGRKIKFWLDIAKGEFAGMGVCSNIKEPLRITDFMLLDQRTGGAHADLDDRALNDYFTTMAEAGLQPVQFGRIWFHTHPFGDSVPTPSGGDDETFKKAFGDCQWSVMLVFSNKGAAYAELQYPSAKVTNYLLDVGYEPIISANEKKRWSKLFETHVKNAVRQVDTVAGKKVKVRRKKGKRAYIKSGTDKLKDALGAFDRRIRGGVFDIDALDDEYAQALELDAQGHNDAVARILRRVY